MTRNPTRKREKYLADGTTDHIAGKCVADELAASGAQMYFIDPLIVIQSNERSTYVLSPEAFSSVMAHIERLLQG